MSDLPSYDLQVQAADDRRRLQHSLAQLKDVLRNRLDLKRNLRQHLAVTCLGVAIASLGLGYSVAGFFTPRPR